VTDILIVGAGPAGAAAGIEAARAGARVCVVDRARFPRPKTCGDAVSNGAAGILAELGVDVGALPHAAVRGAAAILPDGSRIARSYGTRLGYIVGRYHLDDSLRRRLEKAGAEVVEGVQIRSLLSEDGRIVGAEGEALAQNGAPRSFRRRAAIVIAADGPGSVAWTALGAPAPKRAALGLAMTAYFEDVQEGEQGYSEHYFENELPCGYAWVFPRVNGQSNIGVYQRLDRYRRAKVPLRRLLEQFVARHPERFARARAAGRVRSWPLPLARVRPADAAPGLLACGDAGRLIDPLTGEGIWHALHSGRLAGRAALEALAGAGFDRRAARRYRLRVAREVGWPSALRVGIQRGMELVVAQRLYRSSAVRALLHWGYGSGATEVSKSVEC
jgi:geranylgeranyl reductase family protein